MVLKLSVHNALPMLLELFVAHVDDEFPQFLKPVLYPLVDIMGVSFTLNDDMEAQQALTVLDHALCNVPELLFCPEHVKAMV